MQEMVAANSWVRQVLSMPYSHKSS